MGIRSVPHASSACSTIEETIGGGIKRLQTNLKQDITWEQSVVNDGGEERFDSRERITRGQCTRQKSSSFCHRRVSLLKDAFYVTCNVSYLLLIKCSIQFASTEQVNKYTFEIVLRICILLTKIDNHGGIKMGDHSDYGTPSTPRSSRPPNGRPRRSVPDESPLTRQARRLSLPRPSPYSVPRVQSPFPPTVPPRLRNPSSTPSSSSLLRDPASFDSPSRTISPTSQANLSRSSIRSPFSPTVDPFDIDIPPLPFSTPSPTQAPFLLPISSTHYTSTTRTIAVPNPLPYLARTDPSGRVDDMVGELATSITQLMKGSHIPSPRFDHCQKTKSLIHTMASRLSVDNPLVPLHLSLSQKCSLIGFLTGFHPQQVRRILSETSDPLSPPLPWCPPCRPPKATPTAEEKRQKNLEIFCEETRFHLRFFIHDCFREQKRPSLDLLCRAKDDWLKGKDEGRSVSSATLYKCMRAMGFSYRQLTTRVHSFLSPSISSLRNYFLKTMADLRSKTGPDSPYFGYLDETWIYPGMRHNYCWVDSFVEEDPFLAMKIGLTPGMDPEYTKGERLVLVGVFSEEGFIHREIYRTGKKEDQSCRDYHGEMTADVFERYAENAFEELAARAKAKNRSPILVMDNASYHSRYLEKLPTKSKTKRMFVEFLERNCITFDKKLKKGELYTEVISKLDPKKYNVYAVEEIAKKHGVRIVRLPPYHCIYNAIEFAWAWLKGKARDQLETKDNGATAKAKVEAIFDSFPPEFAPKYIRHVREKEEEHISKGSLTFDHADIDTHAFIRAQARADVGLDSHPVPLDGEDEEEPEEEREADENPLLDMDGDPLMEELSDEEDEEIYSALL